MNFGKFILSTNSDAKSTFLDLKSVQVISGSLSFICASHTLYCIHYFEMENAWFYSNLGGKSIIGSPYV